MNIHCDKESDCYPDWKKIHLVTSIGGLKILFCLGKSSLHNLLDSQAVYHV